MFIIQPKTVRMEAVLSHKPHKIRKTWKAILRTALRSQLNVKTYDKLTRYKRLYALGYKYIDYSTVFRDNRKFKAFFGDPKVIQLCKWMVNDWN
jgi:hypothetical protein